MRVISAKLDFLSVAGISAYATGPSSGGGGGGLDYDLLKQALTGAITPDGYPFTTSASFSEPSATHTCHYPGEHLQIQVILRL